MTTRDEYGEQDLERLAADDRLLDVFGAITWEDEPRREQLPPTVPTPRQAVDDPLLGLLSALRADVETDVVPVPALAPVIPLRGRRKAHRFAVASAVTAAVLSVSGVAAAGFSGASSPLYPLHQAIWGPTSSQKALHAAERFAGLAADDIAAGRLTAAGEALDHAEAAITHVDLEEQGNVPARLKGLRDALTAAYVAEAARLQAIDDAKAAAEKAAQNASGDHRGSGSGQTSDSRDSGKGDGSGSGSHDGSGSGDTSGSGSGDGHHGDTAPGTGDGSSSDGSRTSSGSGDTEGSGPHGGDGSTHSGD